MGPAGAGPSRTRKGTIVAVVLITTVILVSKPRSVVWEKWLLAVPVIVILFVAYRYLDQEVVAPAFGRAVRRRLREAGIADDQDLKAPPSLRWERSLPSPLQRVWRAWTDPDDLSRWYGSGIYRCHIEALDLRSGGSYRFRIQSRIEEGLFETVDPPHHLRMTGPRGAVDVRLCEEEEGTRLAMTMPDVSVDDHDDVRSDWSRALDKLERLL